MRGDLRVVREHLAERAPGLPRSGRSLLDETVCVVALETRLDQREEHRLAEHQAVRRVEVLAHPIGVHDEPIDDSVESPGHVIGEDQRVGKHDALDRRVRHVTLVPQRDVLHAGLEIAAQHAGKTTELLGAPRVALVRHGAGALLRARGERLLYLPHLGALEVTYLEGERLDRRAERGARVEQLGMAVARDHLR